MELARSGFYAYCKGKKRKNPTLNDDLIIKTKILHEQSRSAYGSRRMSVMLRSAGFNVGRHKARSLMRLAGVVCKQRRRFRATTESNHNLVVADNILNRQFNVSEPNRVWTSDITCVWTQEGWLYLAAVLDAFSRRVVGWSLADHMRTTLVYNAYRMAQSRRKPAHGLLHHSDRGCQYASESYRHLLQSTGAQISMSRKGNCWDNAITERFFGSLKSECTQEKNYATRAQARAEIIDYIEMFYNSSRLHSSLGYVSPLQFELNYRPD